MSKLRRGVTTLAIILLNMTVVLLIGEALVRVTFHQSMNFDMEMWRYANLLKQRSTVPKLGHEHRPSTSAVLMGVQVAVNSHGMRGDEVQTQKGPGVFRIALLGDSLTMGWGVPQDQLYAHLLEKELNSSPPAGFGKETRFEVLNFGVGNYNTVQEVATLRHQGLAFSPDLILLGYFINDAELLAPQENDFLLDHSYLYAFGKSVFNRFHAKAYNNYQEYYRNLYQDEQPGWHECQQALRDLAEISKQQRVPAIMFILPELHLLSQGYPFADIHEKLTRVAGKIGLPVLDLLANFTDYAGKEQGLWVSATDAHPNALAQPIIAQALYRGLPWPSLAAKEGQSLPRPTSASPSAPSGAEANLRQPPPPQQQLMPLKEGR